MEMDQTTQFHQWLDESTPTFSQQLFPLKHSSTQPLQAVGLSPPKAPPAINTRPEVSKPGPPDPFFLDCNHFPTQHDLYCRRLGRASPIPTEADLLQYWRQGAIGGRTPHPLSPDYTFQNLQEESLFAFDHDDFNLPSPTFDQRQWDLPFQPNQPFLQQQRVNPLPRDTNLQQPCLHHPQPSLSESTTNRSPNTPSSQDTPKYHATSHSVNTTPRSRELTRTPSTGKSSADIERRFPATIQSHQKPYVTPYAKPTSTQEDPRNGGSDTAMWDVGSIERGAQEKSGTRSHVPKSPRIEPSLKVSTLQPPWSHSPPDLRWTRVNALQLACHHGNAAIVKLLLLRGAGTYDRSKKQQTPLHIAASRGHSSVVQMLLQHGSDPSPVDKAGSTPLHLAVLYNHRVCARMLLDANADPDQRDGKGYTALHIAAAHGYTEVVRMLLERDGVDLCRRLDNGKTVLHLAAEGAWEDVMNLLVDYGADINAL